MSETQESKPGRRRNLLINPHFQLSVIGFNVGLAIIAIVALYFQNDSIFGHLIGKNIPELQNDPIFRELVREDRETMNTMFAVTAVLLFLFMTIGGLVLSHRIAGPLYRLRTHMDQVAEGKTDRDVHFRAKDFFPELAASFNKVMARIRKG